jgi:hypothetical protein
MRLQFSPLDTGPPIVCVANPVVVSDYGIPFDLVLFLRFHHALFSDCPGKARECSRGAFSYVKYVGLVVKCLSGWILG